MKKKIVKKAKLTFPDFDKMSREEEAEWWDTHDLGDYWHLLKPVDIVFDLKKPKEEALVIRLQKNVKDKLEETAHAKGLNVSTLARMWLLEKLQNSTTR